MQLSDRTLFVRALAVSAVLSGASFAGVRVGAQTPAEAPTPAQAPQRPKGMTAVTLVENDHVRISRVTFAPGGDDGPMHNGATDVIVIQMTPGQVEMAIGDNKTTTHEEAGKTWHIPKEVQHRIANVGDKPYDLIGVFLKK